MEKLKILANVQVTDEDTIQFIKETGEHTSVSEIYLDSFYSKKTDLEKWMSQNLLAIRSDFHYSIETGPEIRDIKGNFRGLTNCIFNIDISQGDIGDEYYYVGVTIAYLCKQDDFDIPEQIIKAIKTLESIWVSRIDSNKQSMFMVVSDHKGYDLEEFNYEEPYIPDLELYYGKEIAGNHEALVDFVNGEKSGLVIFHGPPGTGKTEYMKKLLSNCENNVIFLPKNMLGALTNPSFVKTLGENRNSVIVVEEADTALEKRGHGGEDSAVENILNITNGMMSDFYKIKIICTFNRPLAEIDDALLRKGRLVRKSEFGLLSKESANKISKLLNFDINYTTSVSLADVYNNESNGGESKTRKIGFGSI